MGETQQKKELLQWHPAFYAGLQIDFAEEAKYLEFENEHMLGSKPMQIDVLIIKKESARQIRKNIGQIFRTHNIVEYKSPEDSLTVDDFYKVFGYACFYKSDTERADKIKAGDITVSLVCSRYPRGLLRHLIKERQYQVEPHGAGIYYICGAMFPVQVVVTKQLLEGENLWLCNLTNDLGRDDRAWKLLRVYEKHRTETLYQAVMNVIVRANEERFKVSGMCEALEELMKDRIEELREEAASQGLKRGLEQGIEQGIVQGMEQGVKQGISQGRQQTLLALIQKKLEKGKSLSQIADELEETQDAIQQLYNQLKAAQG